MDKSLPSRALFLERQMINKDRKQMDLTEILTLESVTLRQAGAKI